MSDDELQDVINSVGVMAEVLALFRDALVRNGFDKDDSQEEQGLDLAEYFRLSCTGIECVRSGVAYCKRTAQRCKTDRETCRCDGKSSRLDRARCIEH